MRAAANRFHASVVSFGASQLKCFGNSENMLLIHQGEYAGCGSTSRQACRGLRCELQQPRRALAAAEAIHRRAATEHQPQRRSALEAGRGALTATKASIGYGPANDAKRAMRANEASTSKRRTAFSRVI
jgi:hypothetical protein